MGDSRGDETNREDRNPEANPTILSGEIGDGQSTDDNSAHVLELTGEVLLDGFTVTAGNEADGGGAVLSYGTGTLSNCRFFGNHAESKGGAVYSFESTLTIQACTFEENSSGWSGGAVYNGDETTVFIENSRFHLNTASSGYGGGIRSSGTSSRIVNSIFTDNTAHWNGGGIYDGDGHNEVVNSLFLNNTARSGGGIGAAFETGYPLITGCVFVGNESTSNYSDGSGGGGGIFSHYGSPKIVNCILWQNVPTQVLAYSATPDVSYSLIEGGYAEGTSIFMDGPLFADLNNPAGVDGILGTGDDGLRITTGSPCIDAGNNADVPAYATTDLTGNSRIFNNIVDIGAYELTGGAAHHFKITGNTAMTAGGTNEIIVTAYDEAENKAAGYTGDKTLVFSGAGPSAGSHDPKCTDKSGIDIPFGEDVVLTFSNGTASCYMKLYKVETARIKVTSHTILTPDAGDLEVTVSPSLKNRLLWVTQPAGSVSVGVIWPDFSIEIVDLYGNRTSDTDQITISPSSGSLEGSTSKAADNGLATFGDISCNTAHIITITGSSSGLSPTAASTSIALGAVMAEVSTHVVSRDYR